MSQLIQLSWNCPVLLREYLQEYGYLEANHEAELFFCADKQIRLEYGQKFGFDVENLINQTPRFGVESRIVSALKKEVAFVRGYISREWGLRFNLHWINFERDKYQSGICNLCEMLRGSSYGEQFYADNERYFSRNMLEGSSSKSNPFCRFWMCVHKKDRRLYEDHISHRVIESLRRVRVLLENAAERHYLTA